MATELGNSLFVKCAIEHELAMFHLYSVLGASTRSQHEFWDRMADDERGQAGLLERLSNGLVVGAVHLTERRLPASAVVEFVKRIKSNTATFAKWGLKTREAFDFAAFAESSLIEQNVYEAFAADDHGLQEELNVARQVNHCHVDKIRIRAAKSERLFSFSKLLFWK